MTKTKYLLIGDNTKRNREWLEILGYSSLRFFLGGIYVYATYSVRCNRNDGSWKEYFFGMEDDLELLTSNRECINCIGNDELFKEYSGLLIESGTNFKVDVKAWKQID